MQMAYGANSLDKLPEFATNPQDNTFDSAIINKTSTLEQTGFVPNTTIKSSQMNTYMKTIVEALRGIVDGLYRNGTQQGIIKANSTAQEWEDYLQKGLNDLIIKTKANNAVHADKSTNVDNIVNNDTGNNAIVNFSIGDKNFSKTVNNVANSKACSGNAASATKLANTRTINISGDATGTAQGFNGESNITIPIDVQKSAALDSINIGDASHGVYFDSNGKPVKVNVVAEASHATNSDNAITAIQAKDAVDETAHKFAFVTQAKYDELKAANTLVSNCLYCITDDTTEANIMQAIESVNASLSKELAKKLDKGDWVEYKFNWSKDTNINVSISALGYGTYIGEIVAKGTGSYSDISTAISLGVFSIYKWNNIASSANVGGRAYIGGSFHDFALSISGTSAMIRGSTSALQPGAYDTYLRIRKIADD
jgi:hypothetical protein